MVQVNTRRVCMKLGIPATGAEKWLHGNLGRIKLVR